MKLLITGTRDECASAVEVLGVVLAVWEMSGFYPICGSRGLGRVCLAVPTWCRADDEEDQR
jgi:hypothetical protein